MIIRTLGMDLQAQDHAHRIGQTKPVLLFRLASRRTIESKILQRASRKRQLGAPIITKGTPAFPSHTTLGFSHNPHPSKFKVPIGSTAKAETLQAIAEIAAQLLEIEGEHIQGVPSTAMEKRSVISDAEADILLDRCKEVFDGRGIS